MVCLIQMHTLSILLRYGNLFNFLLICGHINYSTFWEQFQNPSMCTRRQKDKQHVGRHFRVISSMTSHFLVRLPKSQLCSNKLRRYCLVLRLGLNIHLQFSMRMKIFFNIVFIHLLHEYRCLVVRLRRIMKTLRTY